MRVLKKKIEQNQNQSLTEVRNVALGQQLTAQLADGRGRNEAGLDRGFNTRPAKLAGR